jgi:hypothetical protein
MLTLLLQLENPDIPPPQEKQTSLGSAQKKVEAIGRAFDWQRETAGTLTDIGDTISGAIKSWENFVAKDLRNLCGSNCSLRAHTLIKDIDKTIDEFRNNLERVQKLQDDVAAYKQQV